MYDRMTIYLNWNTQEKHMQERQAHDIPPHAQLIQMGTAVWVSGIVYAAAKLGLADQLAAGP